MELKIYESSGKYLIRLAGRIVLDECDRLKSSIDPLITPSTTHIHLDLSEVEFIDSAGLGALVRVKVSSNKHRSQLALLNPSRSVSDILMVSKLDTIFDVITGEESETLIRELAQPQFQKSVDGPAVGPQLSRGPAMPSMPGMGMPPPGGVQQGGSAGGGSPKEQIDRLLKEAVEYMKRQNYDEAAECYKKAIGISPDYLPAHNNLAIVYEKQDHTRDQAIDQWNKVLELSRSRNDQKHIDRAIKHLNLLQSQA